MTDTATRMSMRGNVYTARVSVLVERLAHVRKQLEVLEAMPGKMPAFRAEQKRTMVRKFEKVIRGRVAWHATELRHAAEAGFPIAEEFEPQRRTILKVSAHV